jgi:cellulose synthase/poly-beta-1,6-N-acetylglucosamine synthase-like glycosyltransferase
MPLTVSVVIPVYNSSAYLAACLESVRRMDPAPLECIVVDDGSTDDSVAIAERAGLQVISCRRRRGPAAARNVGARAARGGLLLFIDSDVLAPPDALARIQARFAEVPERAAVIGSYDAEPGSPDFISQYRNLLHCYIHQSSQPRTCTFWTGCGAIRTEVFREQGGFSEAYAGPSVEDMELGLRLLRGGREIWLDKSLLVKHLKRLSFAEIVKTDVLDRAIPWTMLILRFRSMPADLNLRWEQRASVLLAGVAAAALGVLPVAVAGAYPEAWVWPAGAAALALALLAFVNRRFYCFLAKRKGRWFAIRAFPLHGVHFLCAGLGFALGVLKYVAGSKAEAQVSEPASTKCGG